MIYDWQEREIKSTIDDKIFEDPKQRKEFHSKYLEQVGNVVGFGKLEGDVLGSIYGEYSRQGMLKEMFASYGEFFNAFFIYPYLQRNNKDITHFEEEYKNINLEKMSQKEREILTFVRKFNLPYLMYDALKVQREKYEKLKQYNQLLGQEKVEIEYKQGLLKRNIGGRLKAEFSTNLWMNIFSNFTDCIFINYNKEKDEIIFQDYWFASLRHTLNLNIYYLNLIVDENKESKKIRQKLQFPMLKIILMETENEKYPLIVEGVLGSNLNDIKIISECYDNIRDFIDKQIWNFFSERYKVNNPDDELRYFVYHPNYKGNKSHHQFDDYIKRKYNQDVISSRQAKIGLRVAEIDEKIWNLVNIGNGQEK